MVSHGIHSSSATRRPGYVSALVAIVLPALCGVIGLVIDAGMFQHTRRQAQNAADGAAVAWAQAVTSGQSASAVTNATNYVTSYNGLAGATVTVNSPPTQGAYYGNAGYVEVVVSMTVNTSFISAVGASSSPQVYARAVAGAPLTPPGANVITLDTSVVPGLSVNSTTLKVNGPIWVNSQGSGSTETSSSVNLGYGPYAAQTPSGGKVQATNLMVVGGVDTPANYTTSAGASCLHAQQLPTYDPLLYLPTPTTANGVVQVFPGVNGTTFASAQQVAISLAGGLTYTLNPGIYTSIEITGAGPGTVTFQPGIYVLQGGNVAGNALNINTGGKIIGNGVMFYNTGSDYVPTSGSPDLNDGNLLGTDASAIFGQVYVNATGGTNLTALGDSTSPFLGMLIYQRRWNIKPLTIYNNNYTYIGTSYSRWAALSLQGAGTFQTTLIAGSITASSSVVGSSLTIQPPSTAAQAKVVFLVE